MTEHTPTSPSEVPAISPLAEQKILALRNALDFTEASAAGIRPTRDEIFRQLTDLHRQAQALEREIEWTHPRQDRQKAEAGLAAINQERARLQARDAQLIEAQSQAHATIEALRGTLRALQARLPLSYDPLFGHRRSGTMEVGARLPDLAPSPPGAESILGPVGSQPTEAAADHAPVQAAATTPGRSRGRSTSGPTIVFHEK